MQTKLIIISLLIFLLLSFGFLAYTETKQQSPESQNFWVVYFSSPKDDSLNFVIDNESNETKFHYVILSDNNVIEENNIEIKKGNKQEINLTKFNFVNIGSNKKTIKVTAGNESKEIYKNF